jgi:uncharacterized protein (TIGR02246 family)
MKAAIYALACVAATAGTTVYAQAPQSLSTEWAADWSSKNLEAVMKLYAPEPVFLPTVGAGWEGTDSIRKSFAGILAIYSPHIVLHSSKSQTSGDLAFDSGTYDETITPVKGGKPIPAKGGYLFVFQKQKDGGWKILEQTWTELEAINL